MTSAIDRLDEMGFVVRKGSKGDRRVRIVELTAEGRKFITQMYERHERELEDLMSGIPVAERAALRRGLKKIGLAAQAAVDGSPKS
jgi:MarR family 2-MHQ and catechol resistance regulon transcriptional repressor